MNAARSRRHDLHLGETQTPTGIAKRAPTQGEIDAAAEKDAEVQHLDSEEVKRRRRGGLGIGR